MMPVTKDSSLAMIARFYQPNCLTRWQDLVLQIWKALQIDFGDPRCSGVVADQFLEGVLAGALNHRKHFFSDAEDFAALLTGKGVIEYARLFLCGNITLKHNWCSNGGEVA